MIWTTVTGKSVEGLREMLMMVVTMMMKAIICSQSPLAHHNVQFTPLAFIKENLDDQICAIMQNVMF